MDPNEPTILVYGTSWCSDCIRVRNFLDTKKVQYQWINIDSDLEACAFVERTNHGNRSVPTIIWQDGSISVEPSIKQLISKLDMSE